MSSASTAVRAVSPRVPVRVRAMTLLLALALVALTLGGCGADAPAPRADAPRADAPSPTGVPTLEPIHPPPRPPATGRLLADLRQSSRDAALGRMEVWVGNDTLREVTPTAIRYRDPRFRRPLPGERLRADPARSERGYPLTLPRRPACGAPATMPAAARRPSVTVTYDVARVAPLAFADTVPTSGDGGTGTLTLVARPTGRPGHVLHVDTVAGTPLFTPAGRSSWRPAVTVRGDGPVTRIRLPVQPARCDDHVFMEAAGATAFLVGLRLDGRPGRLVLRMSPSGAARAIAFARDACGL